MSNLGRAFFFGIDVAPVEEFGDQFVLERPGPGWTSGWLTEYETLTFGWFGSHQVWRNQTVLSSEPWRSCVKGYFLHTRDSDGHRRRVVGVELRPELWGHLKTIVVNDAGEWMRATQSLVEAILPPVPGDAKRMVPRQYRSILYLEPEADFGKRETSRDRGQMLTAAAEFVTTLTEQGFGYTQPMLLDDVVLFRGPGNEPSDKSLGVMSVWTAPAAQAEEVKVSMNLWDIVKFLTDVSACKLLEEQADDLPFARQTVRDYLSQLRWDTEPRYVFSRRRPPAVLPGYGDRFLVEKEIAITRSGEYVEALREVRGRLRESAVTRWRTVARRFDGPTPPRHWAVRGVLDELVSRANEQVRVADLTIRRVRLRQKVLTAHLRDLATQEATRTNLALQKAMQQLTVWAVTMAFVGIVVGAAASVFGSDLRQHMCRWSGWERLCVERAIGEKSTGAEATSGGNSSAMPRK